jgi:hypothetical protein
MQTVDTIPVAFAINTCQSAPFTLAPYTYAGVYIGPTWTTCCVGFTASPTEGGTYVNYVTASKTAIGIPTIANQFIAIPQEFVGAARYARIFCHSLGNAIVQTAATSVTVLRKG